MRRRTICILLPALLWIGSWRPSAAQDLTLPITWPDLTPILVADGFVEPVHLADAGDGSGRLFVVEKRGVVHILQNGQRLAAPFLDITDRVNAVCNECGLLSIAFPPDFAETGDFFVYYNAQENLAPPDLETDFDTTIARFSLSADPNRADPASEQRLLVQHQPFANHNGGLILFGPDGYLYAGLGDGGGAGDPNDNAQNPATLLGKMLRIEVGAGDAYTVPADNPFVGVTAYRPEIWAEGLRNPWRFSFDRLTGDLWIGDVGQSAREEIDFQLAGMGGQNYGWNRMEGKQCYAGRPCTPSRYTLPIADYPHEGGDRSVVGGYVYHSANPDQPPVYLYADTYSGRVRGLQRSGATWETTVLFTVDFTPVSFGEDAAGQLYLVDIGSGASDGAIYRLSEATVPQLQRYYLPILPAIDAEP